MQQFHLVYHKKQTVYKHLKICKKMHVHQVHTNSSILKFWEKNPSNSCFPFISSKHKLTVLFYGYNAIGQVTANFD